MSGGGQYLYSDPAAGGQQTIAVLAGPGNPTDTASFPDSEIIPIVPPQSLIGPLFEPVPAGYSGAATNQAQTSAAQLGIDPADFFEHYAIPSHQMTVTCN